MKYEDMVEKLASEILEEAMGIGEEEMEVEADEIDLDGYMQEKIAANLEALTYQEEETGDEHVSKLAAYFEQSQALKQAATEAYLEAEAMEKAAVETLDEMGYFDEK